MKKRRYAIHEQLLVLAFLLAIGLFFLFNAFRYGDVKLFPLITSSIVIVCSGAYLPKAIQKNKELRQKMEEDESFVAEVSVERLALPMIGYLLILVYALLIPSLGFFSSTAIFLLGMMHYLGYRKWIAMLGVTVCIELVVYFLFEKEYI